MLLHKPRSIALALLCLVAIADVAARPDDADPKPAPGRMFVVGRVLDPGGKPVPGATVAVYARSLAPGLAPSLAIRGPIPIGDARADALGRFRIDAPRTSSWHDEAFGAVALAPGHGAGWVALDPDDDRPVADITLRPEQVVHGRLFDLQGRPAQGVTLSVASMARALPQPAGGVRARSEGVSYSYRYIDDLPAWPRPVLTDAEGRFTLRGVGRDLRAILTAHHPRFALQRIQVNTDGAAASMPMTAALVPPQILNVRVTYADTGEPVPHAPLEVMASQGRVGFPADFETDADGRARVNPPPSDRSYNVWAYPPEGQPYLIDHKRIEWPKAALEQSLDLALPRGVRLHGKVTEEGTGKPVPGAAVDFASYAGRPNGAKSVVIVTAPDGSFQLGADHRPGSLFVKGPGDDYMLQTIGNRMVNEGRPGGQRVYSHAYAALDLKSGTDGREVNLMLRRGATATGRVVDPDGQPVRDAWMIGRIFPDLRRAAGGIWNGRLHAKVRDGRFEVHGLDPETDVPVYFLDAKRKLGGVLNLSGKSATSGPVTVRLEPCGAARMRFVGPGGKPVARGLPLGRLVFTMVVTPGPTYSNARGTATLLAADEDNLNTVDPVNYPSEPVPDADGRVTLPVLIPGASYRFIDHSTANRGETGPTVRKEFTVKPGETIDLGDIRIEKPPAPQ